MGDVRYEGGFTIEPPLSYAELTRKPPVGKGWRSEPPTLLALDKKEIYPFQVIVEETVVDMEEGVFIRKEGMRVEPINDTDYLRKMRGEDLRYLNMLKTIFPDHSFTGFIEGVDEDTGNRFRLVLTKDGEFIEIEPTLIWPEV